MSPSPSGIAGSPATTTRPHWGGQPLWCHGLRVCPPAQRATSGGFIGSGVGTLLPPLLVHRCSIREGLIGARCAEVTSSSVCSSSAEGAASNPRPVPRFDREPALRFKYAGRSRPHSSVGRQQREHVCVARLALAKLWDRCRISLPPLARGAGPAENREGIHVEAQVLRPLLSFHSRPQSAQACVSRPKRQRAHRSRYDLLLPPPAEENLY